MLLSAAILYIGTIAAAQTNAMPSTFKVEEQSFQRNGMKIYGKLFIPDRISPMHLVILSHGFGGNHGGFVSTYVAAKCPADVAGLVLLYPAFVLQDEARRRTPDPERIPAEMKLLGKTIGCIYNKDALSFDIYTLMPQYFGRTLIIHGTDDPVVPLSYSERAIKTFPNA